ncbi:MAG: flippase-like domain-containing protein [Saprospiraceae bacterium]|nr:flippase-like domain-containing protein [Saprospiraceae bacterium]
MDKSRPVWQKQLVFIAKIALSITALIIVYRKIDLHQLADLLRQGQWLWFIPALLAFTGSQVISAFRLNTLFRSIGLTLSERTNLRLYWLGMYYNLLLPGGIGGDAYKVVVLRKRGEVKTRALVLASLADRAFGLLALMCLGLMLIWTLPGLFPGQSWSLILIPILILLAWLTVRWIQPVLLSGFGRVLGWSFLVQGFQIGAVLFLLCMIGQPTPWTGFIVLFLASSVLAALPLSYGGAGAREIAFYYGATWMGLPEAPAVAVSVLFYLITLGVSLSGMTFSFQAWNPAPAE